MTRENNGTAKEQHYPSREVCDMFDISSSTLRKWCIALEKHGYEQIYFKKT